MVSSEIRRLAGGHPGALAAHRCPFSQIRTALIRNIRLFLSIKRAPNKPRRSRCENNNATATATCASCSHERSHAAILKMLDNEVLDSQDPFNLACARLSIGIRKMGIIGLIRENIALQTRGPKRKIPCELLSLIAGRREPCIRRFNGICDRLVVADQETPDAALQKMAETRRSWLRCCA